MRKKEPIEITCPCEEAHRFSVELSYSAEKSERDNHNEMEIECPHCSDFLALQIPGELADNEDVRRKG